MVVQIRRQTLALIVPNQRYLHEIRTYDGRQLRSHWIYETTGIQGDAIVAFQGEADVRGENLVDLADQRAGLFIAGKSMLHFIAESFGPDLVRAVFMQRLLVLITAEQLYLKGVKELSRTGDDLYVGSGKLSVSIATVSAVSCLVHFGVNLSTEGTPVKTACLEQLGVDARQFATDVLTGFVREIDSMSRAQTKVRSVP